MAIPFSLTHIPLGLGFRGHVTRTYDRSVKGTRAVDDAPRRREGKVSLIAAVTPQGLDPERCLIHPGAVDTKAFLTYLREVLVSTLKPGQVIFMDNFTIHHNKEVRKLLESAGCYLAYLLTYSPDFNPIKNVANSRNSVRDEYPQ